MAIEDTRKPAKVKGLPFPFLAKSSTQVMSQVEAVCAWVYRLPLPKAARLHFEEVFRGVEKQTADTFRALSATREEVKGVLDIESLPGIVAVGTTDGMCSL